MICSIIGKAREAGGRWNFQKQLPATESYGLCCDQGSCHHCHKQLQTQEADDSRTTPFRLWSATICDTYPASLPIQLTSKFYSLTGMCLSGKTEVSSWTIAAKESKTVILCFPNTTVKEDVLEEVLNKY